MSLDVPYMNHDSDAIILSASEVFKPEEIGQWDLRHRELLQPLARDHKLLKCQPGVSPGWWKVVEVIDA